MLGSVSGVGMWNEPRMLLNREMLTRQLDIIAANLAATRAQFVTMTDDDLLQPPTAKYMQQLMRLSRGMVTASDIWSIEVRAQRSQTLTGTRR